MQGVESSRICLDLNGDVFENVNQNEVNTLLQQSENICTEPEQSYLSSRPQRRSKQAAMARMQEIREWENCSENSTLFRQVADAMDKEFANLNAEERNEVDDASDDYHDESDSSEEEGNLSFVDSDSDEPMNDDDEWIDDNSESESEMSTTGDEANDDEVDEPEHTSALLEHGDEHFEEHSCNSSSN